MAYAAGDVILDDHYNAFVTSLNAMFGAGSADLGYNQTALASVSAGNTIAAVNWTNLQAKLKLISTHQGNNGNVTIDSVANVAAGDDIDIIANLATDIGTLTTSAAAQTNGVGFATAVASNMTNTSTFVGTGTQINVLAFANSASARSFFNLGGKVECSWNLSGHTSDAKANGWAAVTAACGTYQLFGKSSGKTGGSGNININQTAKGFHNLSSSELTVFKQFDATSSYTANHIQLTATLNAAPATAVSISLKSIWTDAAADTTNFNKNIYNVQDQVDGTKKTNFSYEAAAVGSIPANYGTPAWTTGTNSFS